MKLRILSGLLGAGLLCVGVVSGYEMIRLSPTLKIYLIEGGIQPVHILSQNIHVWARFFVYCWGLYVLFLIGSGVWLLRFAMRNNDLKSN
jgi:hypothetical protein